MKTIIAAAALGLTAASTQPPEPQPMILTPEAQMELQAAIATLVQQRDQALAEKEYWYRQWKNKKATCV